jgi:hypothetical protein
MLFVYLMKKIIILVLLALFFVSGCSLLGKNECPAKDKSLEECEFGTFTVFEDDCLKSSCRPSADFNCRNLSEGNTFFDGCNVCSCGKSSIICTKRACSDDRTKGEGEMCGGIAGFACKEGLTCVLDGSYPDAAGKCVKE